jgi:hypothetical protein
LTYRLELRYFVVHARGGPDDGADRLLDASVTLSDTDHHLVDKHRDRKERAATTYQRDDEPIACYTNRQTYIQTHTPSIVIQPFKHTHILDRVDETKARAEKRTVHLEELVGLDKIVVANHLLNLHGVRIVCVYVFCA